jgi:hypothetical protein
MKNMPTAIVIQIGDLEFKGEFNDTPAGQAAAQALPFEWSGSRWGDEAQISANIPARKAPR